VSDDDVRYAVTQEPYDPPAPPAVPQPPIAPLLIDDISPQAPPPAFPPAPSPSPSPPLQGSLPPPQPSPPPLPVPPHPPPQAPLLTMDTWITLAVMSGSTALALFLTLWVKLFRINSSFKRVWPMFWALVDIASAATDFGSDVLFIIEAFSIASSESVSGGARELAIASLVCLILCCCFALSFTLTLVHQYTQNKNKDVIDMDKVGQHSGFFSAIVILSATSIDPLKLLPWKSTRYDGFPLMRMPVHVTAVALLEDVPQLVIQIIFVSWVEWSLVALVLLTLTGLSLLWRVVKRFLLLTALHASTLDARTDRQVVDMPPSTFSVEGGGRVHVCCARVRSCRAFDAANVGGLEIETNLYHSSRNYSS
jgi:hypothetical protein